MTRNPRHLRRAIFKTLFYTTLLISLLLAIRLTWGYYQYTKFQTTIADLRAKGIPLLPADFPDDSQIPPNQNAVTPLLNIATRFSLTRPEASLVRSLSQELGVRSALTPAERVTLNTLTVANAPFLADIDASAARTAIGWPQAYFEGEAVATWPVHNQLFNLRKFMQTLHALAFAAHEFGDDARAFHHLSQIVTLSCVVGQCPSIFSFFITNDAGAVVTEDVESIQATANFQDPAVSAAARALLAALQQYDSPTAGNQNVHQAMLFYTVANAAADAHRTGWFLAPVSYEKSHRRLLNILTYRTASAETTFPAYRDTTPPAMSPSLVENTLLSDLNIIICGAPAIHDRWARLAGLRAAAILLAARLHAAAHGDLPTDATTLIPTYLHHLPLDPFSRTPRPLQYRLDPGGPTVWSIGPDGIDAACATLAYTPGRPTPRNNQPDIPFGAAWVTARSPR